MTLRRVLIVAQWTTGIANAFSMFWRLDEGRYGSALISLACLIITACWLIPKKD